MHERGAGLLWMDVVVIWGGFGRWVGEGGWGMGDEEWVWSWSWSLGFVVWED